DKIGYLFQNYALIENETVYQNIQFVVHDLKNKKELVKEALQKVHLDAYETKKIYQCSGGEQQRIAIARLMLKPCELVLADEPTGSLDTKNKAIVLDLLSQLHKQGKTIVLVTHDLDIIHCGTRHLSLD
ncbi:MAG: ATP-binding cassette domain-containing protein, partial [Coprobacillus sp.]